MPQSAGAAAQQIRRSERPSPSASATQFPPGTKKRGNDGTIYVVVVTRTGVRRWQRVDAKPKPATVQRNPSAARPAKTVYVVDNGGTPFIVHLSGLKGPGVADVRVIPEDVSDEIIDMPRDDPRVVAAYKPWRRVAYSRAWLGKDPGEPGQEAKPRGFLARMLSSRPSWWHGGNSLLLQTGPRRYMYIGSEIFDFSLPKDEPGIQAYVSIMGNSAVPYPYAVGARNTYLMLEYVYISNSLRTEQDPYDQWYWHDLHTGEKYKDQKVARKAQQAHLEQHGMKVRLLMSRR